MASSSSPELESAALLQHTPAVEETPRRRRAGAAALAAAVCLGAAAVLAVSGHIPSRGVGGTSGLAPGVGSVSTDGSSSGMALDAEKHGRGSSGKSSKRSSSSESTTSAAGADAAGATAGVDGQTPLGGSESNGNPAADGGVDSTTTTESNGNAAADGGVDSTTTTESNGHQAADGGVDSTAMTSSDSLDEWEGTFYFTAGDEYAAHLYWYTRTDGAYTNSTVTTVGEPAYELHKVSDSSHTVEYCAVLGKIVFFTDRKGIKFVLTDSHKVHKLLELTDVDAELRGLEVHEQSSRLFFTDQGADVVYRVSVDGESLEAIATAIEDPLDLAIFPTGNSTAWLFITSYTEGKIYRTNLDGLGLEVWKEVPEVRGITTVPKNGHVYWTTGAGSLYRSTVGGDQVETLGTNYGDLVDVTVKPGDDGGDGLMFITDAEAGVIYAFEEDEITGDFATMGTAVVMTDTPRSVCLRSKKD